MLGVDYNLWVALAATLSSWLVLGLLKDLWNRVRTAASIGRGLRRLTPSYWGMFIAHLGFAACVTGIVATSQYSIERDLKMSPGQSETLAGYSFRFEELAQVKGIGERTIEINRKNILLDSGAGKRK